MSKEQCQRLVAAACEVRAQAYVPYSNFPVGAALLTTRGNVYTGCNIENASYGLTICAERSAVANAVSSGEHPFTAIAVVTEGGKTPCGACRQVLAEFSDNLTVYLVDAKTPDQIREVSLQELLPDGFRLEE